MSKDILTQERLKELLSYDPDTGIFTRIPSSSSKATKGKKAGCKTKNDYLVIMIDYKLYYAHRLAWLYVHGVWPETIDHKNRIRDDNKISNLRDATQALNMQNTPIPVNNTSGTKGVSWNNQKNKWNAYIKTNGKRKNLGHFDCKEEAIEIRLLAQEMLHPFAVAL